MKGHEIMQQDDILFYNVAQLIESDQYPGALLSRFPQAVVEQLDVPNPAQWARGCELRFWQKPMQSTTIYLYAMHNDAAISVWFGEHYVKQFTLAKNKITPIEIILDAEFVLHLDIDQLHPSLRYPSTLCRVFFNARSSVCYCGKGASLPTHLLPFQNSLQEAQTTRPNPLMPFTPLFLADGSRNEQKKLDVELPNSKVVPPVVEFAPNPNMYAKKKMLAYGSSITHGDTAGNHCSCYIQLTAQNLNCDVINFGMSGSCTCDYAMADYIASVPDIDFYYLEIGVNMRHRYYAEEFDNRLSYLLQSLQGRNVYITTIYPNRATFLEVENKLSAQEREFNEIIRRKAKMYDVVLLEGGDIMTDPKYLCRDLIHPSPIGHIKMAENLTQLLISETQQ